LPPLGQEIRKMNNQSCSSIILFLLFLSFHQVSNAEVQWVQRGSSLAGDLSGDSFGHSVSTSFDGSVVAVGATGNTSGYVRVFKYNGSSYLQQGQDILSQIKGDNFGQSISLNFDGSVIAIGSTENSVDGDRTGHVYVYEYDRNVYIQRGKALAGEEKSEEQFGFSLSLSLDASLLAVGAPNYSIKGDRRGIVRIFKYDGINYVEERSDILGELNLGFSGRSVSLSPDGSRLAVGAPFNNDGGTFAGQVRVFEDNGTSFSQIGQDLEGTQSISYFGWSTALSSDGSFLAVGAARQGQVQVFQFNGTAHSLRGKSLSGGSFDGFGETVALSFNADILAVGAPRTNYGTSQGDVTVYVFNGTEYIQYGQVIVGDDEDYSLGHSISLNFDGSVLAIGVPNGQSTGQVKIFHSVPLGNVELTLEPTIPPESTIVPTSPTQPPTQPPTLTFSQARLDKTGIAIGSAGFILAIAFILGNFVLQRQKRLSNSKVNSVKTGDLDATFVDTQQV